MMWPYFGAAEVEAVMHELLAEIRLGGVLDFSLELQ